MLSVIIVHYKTQDKTFDTLTALLKSEIDYEFEIIVVDNFSNDGSIEYLQKKFPSCKFILNSGNLGFSKANNIGINQSNGDVILLLNSDVIVEKNTIDKSIKFLNSKENIGVVGVQLSLRNGELDHTCKRGFPTPLASLFYFTKLNKLFKNSRFFGAYTADHIKRDETGEVDSVVGAYMLIPKAVINEVGRLDEDFFMYGEDIDWCYRIKESGRAIWYLADSKAVHLKGASSGKKNKRLIYEFHRSMWLFYKKHYSKKYLFIISYITWIFIWLRYITVLFLNLLRK